MHLRTVELFKHIYCTLQDRFLKALLFFRMMPPPTTESLPFGIFFLSNLCMFWSNQRSIRTFNPIEIMDAS